jgi:hypothetical protein
LAHDLRRLPTGLDAAADGLGNFRGDLLADAYRPHHPEKILVAIVLGHSYLLFVMVLVLAT